MVLGTYAGGLRYLGLGPPDHGSPVPVVAGSRPVVSDRIHPCPSRRDTGSAGRGRAWRRQDAATARGPGCVGRCGSDGLCPRHRGAAFPGVDVDRPVGRRISSRCLAWRGGSAGLDRPDQSMWAVGRRGAGAVGRRRGPRLPRTRAHPAAVLSTGRNLRGTAPPLSRASDGSRQRYCDPPSAADN